MNPLIYSALNDLETKSKELRKNKLAREYNHDPYINPLDGVSEAFATGLYEMPGQWGEIADEYTTLGAINWLTQGEPFKDRIDKALEADQLDYNPADYGADPMLQGLARLGGGLVGEMGIPAISAGSKIIPWAARNNPRVENMFLKTFNPRRDIIGSTGAKNADMAALAKAEEMKAAGIDTDTIYNETGWFLDHPDGRPRFEINDSGMGWGKGFYNYVSDGNRTHRATEFVDHPALYENYNMENTGLVVSGDMGGTLGSYGDDVVKLNEKGFGKNDMQSVSGHELQHAVQERENMARGGNPNAFARGDISATTPRQKELQKHIESVWQSDAYKQEKAQLRYNGVSRVKAREMLDKKYGIADSIKEFDKGFDKQLSMTSFDKYQSLAGEAEARLVQNRMDMPMSERLANPFYKGYDVPLEDQIVRYGDGSSMSIPMDIDTFVKQIEGDDINNPLADAKIRGSSQSGSKYIEFIGPEGDLVEIRVADHPQSQHALTLHGVPDIEIGPHKGADYPELTNELLNNVKGMLNLKKIDAKKDIMPMDEASRMQRARDMGFDTDQTWYHGTGGDFDSFKSDLGGVYFTDNPKYADRYTTKKGETGRNIIPAYLKKEAVFDTRIPAHKKIYEDQFLNKYGNGTPLKDDGLPDWVEADDFQEFFDAEGLPFDAAIVGEPPTMLRDGTYRPESSLLITNGNNIRSKFAKFDPAKKDSANLLDSRLLPIPAAGLLSGITEPEVN